MRKCVQLWQIKNNVRYDPFWIGDRLAELKNIRVTMDIYALVHSAEGITWQSLKWIWRKVIVRRMSGMQNILYKVSTSTQIQKTPFGG